MPTPRRRPGFGSSRAALSLLVSLLVVGSFVTVRAPTVAQQSDGVTTLTGSVTIASPFQLQISTEPYISLYDMTAFVERDLDLEAPPESYVTANLEGDLLEGATFALSLPIAPKGNLNDVDGGSPGDGVQVYSIEFLSNYFGDPFPGPGEAGAWGTSQTSLVVGPPPFEVTGGQVVVWAPDDEQEFSAGFGEDGLFLTEDDPVEPVETGWTVVDLNSEPFERVRDAEVEIAINEGDDGFTDLGDQSFTDAFDALVDELEVRYAFNGVKNPDWDQVREELRPRVEEAERNDDLVAFNEVIVDFTLLFEDGHVGASIDPSIIQERIGGRLGMRLAETEDGEFIVISVSPGLAAAEAGIERGAVVSEWNGEPVDAAVDAVELIFPESTPFRRRLSQIEFLTRGAVGDQVSVSFSNPDGEEQTADLTLTEDVEGADVAANTALVFGAENPAQLPVDAGVTPNGLGYIRVNTFSASPVMMASAWEQALNTLVGLGAPALVVDVRANGGGAGNIPLYFAGSFYDEPFELDRNLYADENGEFVDIGGDEVLPSPVQWDQPVAVLVDKDCASACEIFAAAMAEDEDHLIVGYTPSAGIEAGVFQWNLPGDIYFQASIIRLERDGEIFVEGQGVPPNVEVPATAENLLSEEDVVLAAAEEALGEAVGETQDDGEAPAEATSEASPEGTPEAEASPENIEPEGP
ncbi:MAG: hypothetical protein AVDCRST_MAG49-2001 [uncultured Thermomicrobiales bacterium]|uniref:Tail specific protease domain-containing protein n=1 Tax=uncultured Thermomicrobiales bacterium TaxID=1645740 RepID=A0A6J4UK23_9BACT|nr:MAG: hypothetical protein AVDCRST_MAG49-2001 [uncultured Thermomicrobiales bacterium]